MKTAQKWLLLAGFIGAVWCGKDMYDKHFKGKSSEEIAEMINGAFEKILAFARIVKTGSQILEETTKNLRNGFTSLSLDNVTEEKLTTLRSLVNDINILTQNAPEIQEPLEIISTSIHCAESSIQKN